jgi:calcineurin-like phosphoesterase family protein
MSVYVTADTHLGHRRISAYSGRKFCLNSKELNLLESKVPIQSRKGSDGWLPSDESIERMDNYLLDRINETVGVDDDLYHLGDFCFGPRGNRVGQWAKRYRQRINCRNVYLIWGNHDDYRMGYLFTNTYNRYKMQWNGIKIILSHCAHAVWEHSHHGGWHLYGHSHTTAERALDLFTTPFYSDLVECRNIGQIRDLLNKIVDNKTTNSWETKLENFAEFQTGRRSMDVGVDNAFRLFGEYRPLSLDEIDQYFRLRSGFSIDHHRQENE